MEPRDPWEEDGYRVETPERIDVEYDVARLGSRLLAALLDTVVLTVLIPVVLFLGTMGLAIVVGVVQGLTGEDGQELGMWILALTLILSFAIFWGYYIFFELVWHGQSPGKRWTGLRVIREGGYPINFTSSAVRNLVRIVDFLPYGYAIGAIAMLVDRRSRRLGDLAAGTLVVKERRDLRADTLVPELGSGSQGQPAGTTGEGSAGSPIENLDRLTASDRGLLREYSMRRATLAEPAALALAARMATAFAGKLDHDLEGEAPELFLARLVRELGPAGGPDTQSRGRP